MESSQTDGSLERRSSLHADPMQVAPWSGGGSTPAAAGKGRRVTTRIARAVALDRYLAATAPLARVSRPILAAAWSEAWPQLWGTKAAGRLVQFGGKTHVVLFAGPTPISSVYEVKEVLWAHPQEEARRPGASLWAGAVAVPLTQQLSERLQSAAPMRLPRSLEEMELEAVLRGTKVLELINVPHRARDLLHKFLVNGLGRPAPEQEWPPLQQGMLSRVVRVRYESPALALMRLRRLEDGMLGVVQEDEWLLLPTLREPTGQMEDRAREWR